MKRIRVIILLLTLPSLFQVMGELKGPEDSAIEFDVKNLYAQSLTNENKVAPASKGGNENSGLPDSTGKNDVGRKINLKEEAKLTASHHTTEWVIERAFDGDLSTQWIGEDQPLSWQPTNIIIEFDKPKTLSRLVLLSTKHRDMLAFKDFEVFAWGDKTWAGQSPLTVVKNTTEEINTVDFEPVKTKALRVRIHDTYYHHIFPRLREIEVYEALPGAKGKKLPDASIPNEKKSERMILDRAYGRVFDFPRTKFKESKGYLNYVKTFADTMIASGTDRYGKIHSPMFASLIDLESHRNPEDIPGNSIGQRYEDRSLRGGNLFQDVMLLQAMDNISKLTGDNKYQQAVTDYLTFFLKNCPHPATGLFPWGEHAYWNFYEEKYTYDTHEFLGGVPNSFWERMWGINPEALRKEADGLINHIKNLDNYDFDRHADIHKPMPVPRPEKYGGMNFARHAGFYIGLWTFAYSKTKDEKYLGWAQKMIDHHWDMRSPKTGLPPNRKGEKTASAVSTLSLSLNLLEAAELLPEGKVRKRYQDVATTYMDAILRLPHRPAEGQFLIDLPMDVEPEAATGSYGHPYKFSYGGGFSADYVGLLLGVYRLNKDPHALKLAQTFADYYATHNPPAITEAVFARIYATIIGLFNDLYELNPKPEYLEQSKRYAKDAIEKLYHNGMFRGATNINHYEGDMMVGSLAYNLAWLHALENKSDIKIEPNYFTR
ncbi:MAG: discoidin domain-containing protein [Cyclobacteriaceae bacterium]